jgi:hypothetical protein
MSGVKIDGNPAATFNIQEPYTLDEAPAIKQRLIAWLANIPEGAQAKILLSRPDNPISIQLGVAAFRSAAARGIILKLVDEMGTEIVGVSGLRNAEKIV